MNINRHPPRFVPRLALPLRLILRLMPLTIIPFNCLFIDSYVVCAAFQNPYYFESNFVFLLLLPNFYLRFNSASTSLVFTNSMVLTSYMASLAVVMVSNLFLCFLIETFESSYYTIKTVKVVLYFLIMGHFCR